MLYCCNVTSVLFVMVVYIEVVVEPSTMSDCRKVFLDDPQWLKHIKDPHLKQIRRRTSLNI